MTPSTPLELAAAAHDLRNRLGIAECELRQLQRLSGGDIDLTECLESLAHTNALLEELLQRACRQPGVRVSAQDGTLDLIEVAQRVLAGWRVSIVTRVPRLIGNWEEARIAQLLIAAVSNALQFSPDGGRVEVSLERQAGEAVVSVRDNGIGIPAADLPHISEPFFRARNAFCVADGLGLGLATARLIVEQYGGTLQVQSTLGHGTTVTMRLPLESD
jgi:signal transduction histidine kinase